ncbi:MAG TPA: hypothetical protein VGC79_18410 [Polyangiaceae bacterium]
MKQRGQPSFGLPVAAVVVNLLAWCARVRAIQLLPEPDKDALAHLNVGQRLLTQPFRLDLHWVWLPGYHYYLSALFSLGTRPEAIRFINASLAAVLALLLFGYARARSASPAVPWLAALFCAVAPIVNLMGISAQQETLFSILVLACAWAVEAQRPFTAGLLLAAAAMVRYEAWGAVGVISALGAAHAWPALAQRLPRFAWEPKRLLLVAAPAVGAIVLWLSVLRIASGKWFGTLHELFRFTKNQRDVLSHGPWMDLFWFPVLLPLLLFGLALPLALIGLKRTWNTGFLVPAGIAAFLALSYSSKGSLGSGRYFDALAPFVCLCAAEGIVQLSQRRPSALVWLSSATTVCLAVLAVCLVR